MTSRKKETPAPSPAAQGTKEQQSDEGAQHSKNRNEAKESPGTEHVKAAPPKPDNDAAINFLLLMYPEGPWALTAIAHNRKNIQGKLFRQQNFDEMKQWIAARNGKLNLYVSVNPPMRDFERKASREDIKSVNYLHTDIDARPPNPALSDAEKTKHNEDEKVRILELLTTKLPKGVPPPSIIVSSGGGYNVYWKLKEPLEIDGDIAKAEDAKLYNVHLERIFGGDDCHNIDRILRLPGSINIPNANKLAKGRKAALAIVEKFAADVAYPMRVFDKARPDTSNHSERNDGQDESFKAKAKRVEDVNELDKWGVSDRVKVIIVQGHHPELPKSGDNSRSSWLFDVLCHLYRKNVPDDVIYSVITDKEFGISASVLDKGSNIEKYALRQMEHAKSEITNEAADFRRDQNMAVIANSQHNIRVALRKLGIKVRHDVFQDRLLIYGLADAGPLLEDRAMERLWLAIDEKYNFRASKEFFWVVVSDLARRDGFHPVREYLDSLTWDGTPRVDRWLSVYGGADDTPYTRAVGALTMVAAVRRVRQPGCKFDEMLVLESEQGTNKSSALKILAVEEGWFSDDMPLNVESQKVIERLRGRWIVECGELKGMKQGGIEHVKAFLSRTEDRARLVWDKLTAEVPRQSVCVGTTNSSKYLRDTTGARRFWPLRVKAFDLVALRRDRDQLWAEAAQREAAGESIRLDPALYAAAAVEQAERSVEDPFFEQIAHVLSGLTGKILNVDAWEIIGVPVGMRTQDINGRFGEAMKALGWERTEGRIEGKKRNVYARGDKQQREVRIRIERDDNNSVRAWAELDVDQRQQDDGRAPF